MAETSPRRATPSFPQSAASVAAWPADRGQPAAIDLSAIADLVTATGEEVADRARAALQPVLPHDALVLVTPDAAGFPVQIAASRELRGRLGAVQWASLLGEPAPASPQDGAVRLALPDVIGGLRAVGWTLRTSGRTVTLIVGAQRPLEPEPAQERAAIGVAKIVGTRAHETGADPSPGTLAFSRTISLERERVRWELHSHHTVTLTALLRLLRRAARPGDGEGRDGRRSASPAVTEAIDLASRVLLEMKAVEERDEAASYVAIGEQFAAARREVRDIVRATDLQLVSDLRGEEAGRLPAAIAHAARAVTRVAALQATSHAGGERLRLDWRFVDDLLTITVSDTATGVVEPTDAPALAAMRRQVAMLGGTVRFDVVPGWGSTLTCELPLYSQAPAPDTPATHRIAELRPREREVLELMVLGLRNRDIAERLFITVRTVKFHVSNILQKLQVQSRTEAISVAHSAGISALETGDRAEAAG